MKTSAVTCFSFLAVLAAAAGAAAQASRPGTLAPPSPSSTSTARPAPATPPPGVPAATGPRAASAASTAPDYRLVNGDKLRIEVYKDAQLSQSLQIRPDGKITLPLVGDIAAAGKTSSELRDTLSTSLKEYVANPVVTVIVVETMPQTIHVMGEVNSPGPQVITGETSILQALASAGGFKDFAKKKSIQVLRPGPKGTTKLMFDYNAAVKGEAKIMTLLPGDTVIVP